jgi:hypothetical protein
VRHEPRKCFERPRQAARSETETLVPVKSTAIQRNGLARLLEMAQAETATARDPQARRSAQHRANSLRRRLRPAPTEAPGPRPVDVAHWTQLYRVVAWAEGRGR